MRRVTPKIPYPCIPARFSQMRDKYQRGEMRLWNDLDEILQLICSLCLPPLFSKTSARNIAAGGLTVCYSMLYLGVLHYTASYSCALHDPQTTPCMVYIGCAFWHCNINIVKFTMDPKILGDSSWQLMRWLMLWLRTPFGQKRFAQQMPCCALIVTGVGYRISYRNFLCYRSITTRYFGNPITTQ